MEIKEILEGKKIDNLEDTSASDEEEKVPELSNSPVPTEEEIKDAELEDGTEVSPEDEINNESPLPETEPTVEPEPAPVPEEPVSPVVENVEQPQVHEENGVTDMPAMKTFTQSQVDDIAGKVRSETRDKTFRYIYDRYGVKDEAELDELIGNAQRYDTLKEKYDMDSHDFKEQASARDKELMDVKEQVALLQSGIDKERFEDAKFILRGKGLEVTAENIANELATHPEWKGVEKTNENFTKVNEPTVDTQPTEPVSKISVLGNDNNAKAQGPSEEDFVLNRMFKV